MVVSNSMDSSVNVIFRFDRCPGDDVLLKFDRGEVRDHLIDPIGDHVSNCQRCQKKIKGFAPDDFESSLRQLEMGKARNISDAEESAMNEIAMNQIIDQFEAESKISTELVERPKDRFQLTKVIGSGQFGKVHLAYDAHHKSSVALKITDEDVTFQSWQTQVFLDDVAQMQNLNHPSIIEVLDFGRWSGQRAFVTMPIVNGKRLGQWLHERYQPIWQALGIFHQILDAVEHIHNQGLLHRNLKPANVFLSAETGQITITDVGLFVDERYLKTRPVYDPKFFLFSSPEQLRFEGHRMGPNSDIYSLGQILKQMIESCSLEGDPSKETLSQIADECTRPLQSERYQTVDELRTAIKACDI